jgi:hypothetical protein
VVEQAFAAFREFGGRDPRRLHRETISALCPAVEGASFGTMARIELDRASAAQGGLFERATSWQSSPNVSPPSRPPAWGTSSCSAVEAGVGKTALIREFCERHGGSATIAGGACEPLFAPRPLGPFLEIAQSLDGDLLALVEGAMPYQVVAELAAGLRRRAPVILVLDDVHWADEATLDVFRLLARRVESVPALVVASYRDDQLDVRDPLQIVLGELATSSSISRMRLSGLSPAAVAELARAVWRRRRRAVRQDRRQPVLRRGGARRRYGCDPGDGPGRRARSAARLGPSSRAILEAVAVAPPRPSSGCSRRLRERAPTGSTSASARECCDRPGGISFRHELARLAVEESVSPQRKLELNRAALAALSEPPSGPSITPGSPITRSSG